MPGEKVRAVAHRHAHPGAADGERERARGVGRAPLAVALQHRVHHSLQRVRGVQQAHGHLLPPSPLAHAPAAAVLRAGQTLRQQPAAAVAAHVRRRVPARLGTVVLEPLARAGQLGARFVRAQSGRKAAGSAPQAGPSRPARTACCCRPGGSGRRSEHSERRLVRKQRSAALRRRPVTRLRSAPGTRTCRQPHPQAA